MVKILHVDDNEQIRFLVKAILKSKKYDCTSVSSAEEGLKLMKKNKYDTIILDMKLPGKIQGRGFLKKMGELKINIPVIPLTANPKSIKKELKTKFPELVSECVLKPFEAEKLLKCIKKAIK